MGLNENLSIDIARRYTTHIPAKQADHGYDIVMRILRNGVDIVTPSSDTATFRAGKPDGTIYYGNATVNEDKTVSIHVDDDGQMLAVPGCVVVDVTLNDGSGAVKSTQNFVIDVQAAPGGEAIPSTSVFIELQELVDETKDLNVEAEAYAAGTRDGVPVEPGDPAYHNNAPYYLQETEDAKDAAEAALAEFTGVTATAQTLAPGSPATANYSDGVLTFGIPEGIQGIQGPQGLQGPEGAPGADPVAFTVSLPASAWSDGAQTVSDARFLTGDGYTYMVYAAPSDTYKWQDGDVYADDVVTAGQIVFHTDNPPTDTLTANVIRLEVA